MYLCLCMVWTWVVMHLFRCHARTKTRRPDEDVGNPLLLLSTLAPWDKASHCTLEQAVFFFLLAWWPGSLSDSLISTYIFTKLEWQAFMTTPRCWLQGPNLLPYDCTSGTFTHWATSVALVMYKQNSSWFFSTETVFYYIPILRFHHWHSMLSIFLYKHPIVFLK